MAGGDGGKHPRDADEQKLLGRLRAISIVVVLGLVALLAVVDVVGRLLISPDFHVGDVIFLALVGALMTLLGLESIARVAGGR